MRLKVTSLSKYNKDKGWVSKTGSPVWQFVAREDTPFEALLQPLDEVVEVKRSVTMLELVSSLEASSPTQLSPREQSEKFDKELSSQNEDLLPSFLSVDEKVEEPAFKPNLSVIGYGVSAEYAMLHQEELCELRVPVYVYHDLRNKLSLSSIEELTRVVDKLAKLIYVFQVSLPFSELQDIIARLRDEGYRNVRFIGDNVLKLDGSNMCGLFHNSLVKHFSLEYNYVNNVHTATQVKLLSHNVSSAPVANIDYASAIRGKVSKKKAKPKDKSSATASKHKAVKKTVSAKKAKPARVSKSKIDYKSLFS